MKMAYQTEQMTVFHSALYQTTTTVLQTPDLVLLVDPNLLPQEIETIREHVTSVLDGRPLYLLFTHSDWDHVIGYRKFPEAITIGSTAMANHPDRADVVLAMRKFDARNYITRDHALDYPELDYVVEADGQQLTVGGTTLTFYLAPGHTPDGLFTVVEPLEVFVAGDYLSDVEYPFINQDAQLYEATMAKVELVLERHAINVMVPGHGSVTTSQEEMRKRKQDALDYIRELRARVQAGRTDFNDLIAHYEYVLAFEQGQQSNVTCIKRELER